MQHRMQLSESQLRRTCDKLTPRKHAKYGGCPACDALHLSKLKPGREANISRNLCDALHLTKPKARARRKINEWHLRRYAPHKAISRGATQERRNNLPRTSLGCDVPMLSLGHKPTESSQHLADVGVARVFCFGSRPANCATGSGRRAGLWGRQIRRGSGSGDRLRCSVLRDSRRWRHCSCAKDALAEREREREATDAMEALPDPTRSAYAPV